MLRSGAYRYVQEQVMFRGEMSGLAERLGLMAQGFVGHDGKVWQRLLDLRKLFKGPGVRRKPARSEIGHDGCDRPSGLLAPRPA